jgi:hypothetical protein
MIVKTYTVVEEGRLNGAKCKLVRRTNTGSFVVELLEDYRPYEKGDRVCLGPGGISKNYDHPFSQGTET